MSKKILITNADSKLAIQFISYLHRQPSPPQIIALSVQQMNLPKEYLSEGVSAYTMASWHLEKLRPYFETGIDEVYHLNGGVDFRLKKQQDIYTQYFLSTKHLVNLSLNYGVKKMMLVSSTLYADCADNSLSSPVNEDINDPLSPKNHYAQSRYLSEIEMHRAMAEGLPAVILSPAVILYKESLLWANVWMGKNGTSKMKCTPMSYVYVEDVVRAMHHLMSSPTSNHKFVLSAETVQHSHWLEAMDKTEKENAQKKGQDISKIKAWMHQDELWGVCHEFSLACHRVNAQKWRTFFPKFSFTSLAQIGQ